MAVSSELLLKNPLRLSGVTQSYAWGKRGRDSLVAKLSGAKDLEAPYAEWWFGAHVSAPSEVYLGDELSSGVSLLELIKKAPQAVLGERVCELFGESLPFLFKVLSIHSPLSIQAHPDLELARTLHGLDPKRYPDANHKPEMAFAVTDVTLLYGIRPSDELKDELLRYQEFSMLIEELSLMEIKDFLKSVAAPELSKKLFELIFHASPEIITKYVKLLYARIAKQTSKSAIEIWIEKVSKEYPEGDVGVFCFYLLNLVSLKPGDVIFIGANIAHAYLEGDLVECMANSDNVVRAGLTPKPKDVDTLLSMLDHEQHFPTILLAIESASPWKWYAVPAREFTLACLDGPSRVSDFKDEMELVFSLSGVGQFQASDSTLPVAPGDCFLLSASCTEATLELETGKVFRVRVA